MKRIAYIDFLRVVAAVSVICIHVSDELVNAPNHKGGIGWMLYTVINVLCRYAVPLFILLSGSLIRDDKKKDTVYVIRKYTKLFLLFPLYWLALFYIQPWKQDNSFTAFFQSFFKLEYLHLYFIQVIFMVQIVYTKFQNVIAWIHQLSLFKLLIIQTVFFGIYVWMKTMKLDIVYYNIILAGVLFLPMFLLGRLLYRKTFFTPAEDCILKLGFFLYILLPILKIRFLATDEIVGFLTHALSPLPTIAAAQVFLFAKQYLSRLRSSVIQYAAGLTLGVYLIHPLVIAVINRYFMFEIHMIKNNMIFWIGWKICLIITISFAVSAMFKTIQFLLIKKHAKT